MSALSRLARRMAEGYYAHPLLSLDSVLFRPVYRCASMVSRRFRSDHCMVAIRRFEQAPGGKILEALPARSGWCHPPQRCDQDAPVPPRPVNFPSVRVVTLRNQVVEAGSSFPFDRKRSCLYVDQEVSRLPSNASVATGHLAAHGCRNAMVVLSGEPVATKDGVFLGGNGSSNYYHWLLEIVTKLHVLPQLPELAGLPLLVSSKVAELPSFAETLQVLVPDRELVFLDEGVSYLVNQGVFIEPLVTAPFNLRDCDFRAEYFLTRPEAVHYLRAAVLPAAAKQGGEDWPRRIYLARGKRRAHNQDELVAVAARNGFEIVFMEQHSFLKQAAYFANARIIVGPSGAAWSNLVFASQDCRACCWVPEEVAEFAAFSNIAGIIGLDFRNLTYDSGVCNSADAFDHSYRICPELFQQTLDQLATS